MTVAPSFRLWRTRCSRTSRPFELHAATVMDLTVVFRAQPDDAARFSIIVMMPLQVVAAVASGGLACRRRRYAPVPYCTLHRPICGHRFRIPDAPCLNCEDGSDPAMWLCAPLTGGLLLLRCERRTFLRPTFGNTILAIMPMPVFAQAMPGEFVKRFGGLARPTASPPATAWPRAPAAASRA
jgi:hypothetical protein